VPATAAGAAASPPAAAPAPQTILAAVIMAVTFVKLQDVDFSYTELTTSEASCLLGEDPQSGSACVLVEVIAGVTIALGLVVGILQCVTCYCCGFGGLLDFLFACAGVVIWLGTAVTVQNAADAAANSSNPAYAQTGTDWRNAVVVMCWVEMGLFATIAIASLARCATGGRRSRKDVD
jgi:hypothetical protein